MPSMHPNTGHLHNVNQTKKAIIRSFNHKTKQILPHQILQQQDKIKNIEQNQIVLESQMMNYEEISNRAMILENLSEDLEDEEEGKRIVCMFCKRNNDSVCSKCQGVGYFTMNHPKVRFVQAILQAKGVYKYDKKELNNKMFDVELLSEYTPTMPLNSELKMQVRIKNLTGQYWNHYKIIDQHKNIQKNLSLDAYASVDITLGPYLCNRLGEMIKKFRIINQKGNAFDNQFGVEIAVVRENFSQKIARLTTQIGWHIDPIDVQQHVLKYPSHDLNNDKQLKKLIRAMLTKH